jgi:predicted nucleic acid-binding protein
LAQADIVRPDDVPAVTRDPHDDIFFATAKLGNARYIVSEDRDHLDIKASDGIRIVTAHEFLHILDQKGDEHELCP